MNTALMTKLQTLIYSNQDKLEALVGALESVCKEENATVAPEAIHPLESTVLSKKDIGSLVHYWDGGDMNVGTGAVLRHIHEGEEYKYHVGSLVWTDASPYRGAIKLHFKPHYATEDSERPSELTKPAVQVWVAMLFNGGNIIVSPRTDPYSWKIVEDCPYVIGYQVLSFVNPILEK